MDSLQLCLNPLLSCRILTVGYDSFLPPLSVSLGVFFKIRFQALEPCHDPLRLFAAHTPGHIAAGKIILKLPVQFIHRPAQLLILLFLIRIPRRCICGDCFINFRKIPLDCLKPLPRICQIFILRALSAHIRLQRKECQYQSRKSKAGDQGKDDRELSAIPFIRRLSDIFSASVLLCISFREIQYLCPFSLFP